jgi:hypothetical protein
MTELLFAAFFSGAAVSMFGMAIYLKMRDESENESMKESASGSVNKGASGSQHRIGVETSTHYHCGWPKTTQVDPNWEKNGATYAAIIKSEAEYSRRLRHNRENPDDQLPLEPVLAESIRLQGQIVK